MSEAADAERRRNRAEPPPVGMTELYRAARLPGARPARPPRTDQPYGQVAELEEMVARTHERAAELYESWLKQPLDDRGLGLERRAQMHRELAAATRSVERLAERTLSGFEARVEATMPKPGKSRSLVTLAALECLRVLINKRIQDTVAATRRDGATWAEIATALHVTRQTAHQRYR